MFTDYNQCLLSVKPINIVKSSFFTFCFLFFSAWLLFNSKTSHHIKTRWKIQSGKLTPNDITLVGTPATKCWLRHCVESPKECQFLPAKCKERAKLYISGLKSVSSDLITCGFPGDLCQPRLFEGLLMLHPHRNPGTVATQQVGINHIYFVPHTFHI